MGRDVLGTRERSDRTDYDDSGTSSYGSWGTSDKALSVTLRV
jgi:hypothetical protein